MESENQPALEENLEVKDAQLIFRNEWDALEDERRRKRAALDA